MKVVELRGFHLSVVPDRPLGNARMFIRRRDFLVVQLVCDNGVSGWGEAFSSPWAAAALVRKQFAPLVLGRSPQQFGRLYAEMTASLNYDRRGAAMMAVSALDMALHDAAARARNMSVADMLGGRLRDKVMAYASGPFMREEADPYEHYTAEAARYLELGFRALKPRAGRSPRHDGTMVAALRRAVGPDVGLMVDINQGYAAGAACSSARHMEEGDLLWIEEPVQPEDMAGYRSVSAASSTAVAGGEALASLAAFRDFLASSGVAVLQPDIAVCGGFSGFQRIAAMAAAHDMPVMPHMFGTTISFHASLQMASLLPQRRGGGPAPYPYVELDPTGNPLVDGFVAPLGQDGMVTVAEGPGIGIDLTPEALEPWITEHWSVVA